jgi:outer membrane protein TolC
MDFSSVVAVRLAFFVDMFFLVLSIFSDFPVLKGDAMDNRRSLGVCTRSRRLLVGLLCVMTAKVMAEPLPLKRAVELALTHATATEIAAADERHALASYREGRATYIPQFIFGAGLGKSWGYPLTLEGSAPSIFNFNSQSTLFNSSLSQFIKAARSEWQATTLQSKDRRNEVIQDTVMSYLELSMWEQRLSRLQEEESLAMKLEEAVTERVKEGIESPLERTKARLAAARVRMRIAQAESSADVLREHLAKLTGLPRRYIEPVPDSWPAFPAVNQDSALAKQAEDSSPVVQAAAERARGQYLKAQGEHKALLPSIDFAAQYARLSTYNNYDQFFQPHSFRANNATVGVAIRFPVFNPSQRARADAADADVVRAKRQVEAARNQVSEDTLKLQRNVHQLEAAQEVAQLELEVASANLDALQTRVDAGTVTVRDLGDSRAQVSERFITLQDTTFELQRARIGLLRATGDLENWINRDN